MPLNDKDKQLLDNMLLREYFDLDSNSLIHIEWSGNYKEFQRGRMTEWKKNLLIMQEQGMKLEIEGMCANGSLSESYLKPCLSQSHYL